MPFLKQLEARDLSSKYGLGHHGVVALEPIRAGEPVFQCDEALCNYFRTEYLSNARSKAEVQALMDAYPESADFIRYYTYMLTDDLFLVPLHYEKRLIGEECLYFNHSCDCNCGFGNEYEYIITAIRDIAPGEELTYDYCLMETENSLLNGVVCKCGSKNCHGELKFDWWRDPEWQAKYEKYAGVHVKEKIQKLREEQEKK